jgi:hypothetical protein
MHKGVSFLPLLIASEGNDGTCQTFVRAIVNFDRDGCAPCRGKVPQGAQITFGSLKPDDVLESARQLVQRVNQEENVNAAMFFSCIIRQLSIGTDLMKELTTIRDNLRGGVPFVASYSGGEISPLGGANYFHNYSLIACLL